MNRITILIPIFILLLVFGCTNTTNPQDDVYKGESALKGSINLSSNKVSFYFNDTLTMVTYIPAQKYRMKGTLALESPCFSNSSLKLISPIAYPGMRTDRANDSLYKERYLHIRIDLYPNQNFSQEWKIVPDSFLINNLPNGRCVGFRTILYIDSIYLDMDTLYQTSGVPIYPIPVPEKRWYDCRWYIPNPDYLFLERFFYWFSFIREKSIDVYFKNNY
ncbi:MAG: hypothetical protein ABFD00_09585 [Chloroherpetonaceae bacterium]|nr:hypothetical protein [bacterium]